MRDAHERDLITLLRRAPPAAFVFMDHAPLIAWNDAVVDFHASCPEAAALVDARYRLAGAFGLYRVFLRNDVAALPAGPPGPPRVR